MEERSHVWGTMMPESAQTKSSVVRVNFNNLVLKRWLRSIGPIRRCEMLKKLKADLQGLGLTRRQVHRGLVQLSTKPRVVLTRLPPYARFGLNNFLENQEERNSESCRRSASFEHSRLNNEKVHVRGTAGSSNKEDIKCDKNPEKLSIRVSINNTRGLFIPEKGSKLISHPAAIFNSFDKALEQFDKLMYSKVNKHEMSFNKQTSATVSADSSTCVSRHKTWMNKNDLSVCKKSRNNENMPSNNNARRRQRTPELTEDIVGTSTVRVPDQSKKNRIKLNLISCYGRKANAKPETKPNVVKKLDSGKKCIDNKVEYTVNNDKFLKPESNGNVLAGTEVAKKKENLCKRKLHETITCDVSQGREKICALGDESKEFNKNKRKKLRSKFRIYFGDCITISEDEQDHDILEKRFKRRRDKNSVESCDSGLCVSESRMTKCIKTLTGTKKSILDAVTCERLNEEASRNITIRNVADRSEKNTESNKAADPVDNVMSAMKVANTEKQNKMRTKNKNTNEEDTPVEKLIGVSDRSTITRQVKTTTSMAKPCLEKETQVQSEAQTEVELDARLEVQSGGQPKVQLEVQSKVQPAVQQEVQSKVQPKVQLVVASKMQPEVQLDVQSKVQPDVQVEVQAGVQPNVQLKVQSGVQPKVQLKVQSDVQPNVQVEVQSDVQPNVQVEMQSKVQAEAQIEVQPDVEPNVQLEVQSKVQAEAQIEVQPGVEPKVRTETEESQLKADANEKSQALFEPQESVEEQLESEIEAEKKSDIDSTCETLVYDSNKDTDNDSVQTQENNLDMRDLTELLNMSFDETCQITLNENVVSITEPVEEDWRQNIANRNIDENGNLRVLPEVQTSNNQVIIKQEVPDHIEENNNSIEKDMLLLFYGKEQNVEDVPTNNTSSLPHIEEPIVQEPELNTTIEKIDNLPNRTFQRKLRVLSSAELGSRWCPTPINAITSPVAQTRIEPMSEVPFTSATPVAIPSAVLPTERPPPTISATTVPIFTPTSTNRIDVEPAEPIDIIFIKILNLIQSLRLSSSIFKLDYNKLLLTEFEKLRSVANTDNYIALMEGVLCVLNTKLLVNPQLSLLELFSYAPSLKLLYLRTIKENTEQPNLTICNPMITNHSVCCNQQLSQNSSATSVETTLQNLLLTSNLKSRQRPINVSSKQSQQNIKKNDAAQLQNNVSQNNVTVPSMVVNNQNVHQQKYRTSKQRPFVQQKVSNSYGVKQKSVTNTYTTQSFPIQPSVIQSAGGNNAQGGIQIPAQVTNSSFINQQHVSQCVFMPQVNTSYNANPSNYSVQQTKPMHANMPNVGMPLTDKQHQTRGAIPVQPTYMSQNIQVQSIPQQVPVNYIPKPVQTMFSTNIPHSVPNYMQQNQNINQRVPAPAQLKVPQNHMPEQPPSSQYMHNAYSNKIASPVVLAKKIGRNIPVSLESTTKMFDVLKYLSDYQKAVLLKQMDFYFGCTTWLQQQFTSGQWQKIHMQRSVVLHFQTLLKHLVEKSTKDLSNKSQASAVETNIYASIKIDMPKTVQIIVRENEETEGIRYKVDVSNINKNCVTCEENRNVMTVLKEAEDECNKETDKLQNEELQILDKKQGQKDKSIEEKSLQDGNPVDSSILVTRETLDTNVHQKDEAEKESENVSVGAHDLNISRQSLNELENIIDNLSQIVEDKTIAVSDLKLANQDVLQQSGLHLVTVEISSESEQITVINTNTENGKELISDNPVECEKLQEKLATADNLSSLKNTVCGMSIMSLPKTSQDIKFNTDSDKSLSQEPTISQIADVRSISLETFEKMDYSNNVPSSSAEEKMEEEEIKVCLFCGGPSTVACSICLEAKYCSKDCFELHWEDHYKDCIPVESIYL